MGERDSHAATTCDHANLCKLISCSRTYERPSLRWKARGKRTLVLELGDGTLDGELLAGLEVVNVLGHLALVVVFDEEDELAGEI